MANHLWPRLDFWRILGLDIDANRPTQAVIDESVTTQVRKAKDVGALTNRVAWEILESAKVLKDDELDWPTILNYGYTFCDRRHPALLSAPSTCWIDRTVNFAKSELNKQGYRARNRGTGPALENVQFNHNLTFQDLLVEDSEPSICIGEVAWNGRLVFAYLDSQQDQFYGVVSDIDEDGKQYLKPYERMERLAIALHKPFTTRSKAQIKRYIAAYRDWTENPNSISSVDVTVDAPSSPILANESVPNGSGTPAEPFLWFDMRDG